MIVRSTKPRTGCRPLVLASILPLEVHILLDSVLRDVLDDNRIICWAPIDYLIMLTRRVASNEVGLVNIQILSSRQGKTKSMYKTQY